MFEINNKLYSDVKDNKIVENFSHLDIIFDPSWQRIGVNLSGGADSALLTYFLCTIIDKHSLNTKIDVITYQRCWETRPWQGYISEQVYGWLKNKFPNIIENRRTYIYSS